MSGPYQRRDLSNCNAGRLRIANNRGIVSVKMVMAAKLSEFVYL